MSTVFLCVLDRHLGRMMGIGRWKLVAGVGLTVQMSLGEMRAVACHLMHWFGCSYSYETLCHWWLKPRTVDRCSDYHELEQNTLGVLQWTMTADADLLEFSDGARDTVAGDRLMSH